MPVQGLHHLDLAVKDVERSLRFYLALLGPLGVAESDRFPTYRGTEEVVVLRVGSPFLSFRPRTAASTATTTSESSTSRSLSMRGGSSTARTTAASNCAPRFTSRLRRTGTFPGTGRCSCSIPTESGSRSSAGRRNRATAPQAGAAGPNLLTLVGKVH